MSVEKKYVADRRQFPVGCRIVVNNPGSVHHGKLGTVREHLKGWHVDFAAIDFDVLTPTQTQTVEELRAIGIMHDTATVCYAFLTHKPN